MKNDISREQKNLMLVEKIQNNISLYAHEESEPNLGQNTWYPIYSWSGTKGDLFANEII